MNLFFHKTTLTVEVLSDKKIDPEDGLGEIFRGMLDGDVKGSWRIEGVAELTHRQMADALELKEGFHYA